MEILEEEEQVSLFIDNRKKPAPVLSEENMKLRR